MKRITIIIFSLLFFASCEKLGTDSNVLVGKWHPISYEKVTVYASGKTEQSSGTYDRKDYWDFNNDGTVKCVDEKGSVKEYTYSLDKDNMTLTIGSNKIPIKEITRTSLITIDTVDFLDGYTVNPPGKGTSYLYTYWKKSQ